MSIMMPSNYSDWVAAGKEVANELGAIGIKVSIDTPTAAQYTSATQSGNFDVAFGGFGGTGDPYTDFNNALNSAFAAPVGTATANNFERFKSPAGRRRAGHAGRCHRRWRRSRRPCTSWRTSCTTRCRSS